VRVARRGSAKSKKADTSLAARREAGRPFGATAGRAPPGESHCAPSTPALHTRTTACHGSLRLIAITDFPGSAPAPVGGRAMFHLSW
jgi:hypothetical protein